MDTITFIKKHLEDASEPDYEIACLKAVSFLDEIYEIAFGDNAINKDYSEKELINMLRYFSDTTDKYEGLE
jgi:hypothetical protein